MISNRLKYRYFRTRQYLKDVINSISLQKIANAVRAKLM